MLFKKILMFFLIAGISLAIHGVSYADDAKSFLADKHQAQGLKCASCHGEGEKTRVTMDKCLKCHESYQKVAEKTANMERNPHTQGHFIDLQCTTCHRGHKDSENYCGTCHKAEPMK